MLSEVRQVQRLIQLYKQNCVGRREGGREKEREEEGRGRGKEGVGRGKGTEERGNRWSRDFCIL